MLPAATGRSVATQFKQCHFGRGVQGGDGDPAPADVNPSASKTARQSARTIAKDIGEQRQLFFPAREQASRLLGRLGLQRTWASQSGFSQSEHPVQPSDRCHGHAGAKQAGLLRLRSRDVPVFDRDDLHFQSYTTYRELGQGTNPFVGGMVDNGFNYLDPRKISFTTSVAF